MPRSMRSKRKPLGETAVPSSTSSKTLQSDPLTQALMPSSSKLLSSPTRQAAVLRTPSRRRAGITRSSKLTSTPSVLTPNQSKANKLLTRPSVSKFSPVKVIEDAPSTPSRIPKKAAGGTTAFETPQRSRSKSVKGRVATPFKNPTTPILGDDNEEDEEEDEEDGDEVLVPDSLASSPAKLPPTIDLSDDGVLAQSTPVAKKKDKRKGKKRNSDIAFEEEEDDEERLRKRAHAKKIKATTWHWELNDELPSTPPSPEFKHKKVLGLEDDSPIDFNYPSSSIDENEAVEVVPETQPTQTIDSEEEDSTEEIEDDENEEVEEEEDEEQVKATDKRKKKPQLSTAALQSLLPKRRNTRLRPTTQKKKAQAYQKKKQQQPKRPARKVLGDVTSSIVEDELLDDLDNPDVILDEEDELEESFEGTIFRDESTLSSSPTSQADERTPAVKGRGGFRRKAVVATAAAAKGKGKGKAKANAKGKGKAKAAPKKPALLAQTPAKVTYGSNKRRQSTSSDKENMSPSRSSLIVAADSDDNGEENARPSTSAGRAVTQTPKEDLKRIAQKFKEVDEWDLCFEDVSADTSSDGVVKGGR